MCAAKGQSERSIGQRFENGSKPQIAKNITHARVRALGSARAQTPLRSFGSGVWGLSGVLGPGLGSLRSFGSGVWGLSGVLGPEFWVRSLGSLRSFESGVWGLSGVLKICGGRFAVRRRGAQAVCRGLGAGGRALIGGCGEGKVQDGGGGCACVCALVAGEVAHLCVDPPVVRRHLSHYIISHHVHYTFLHSYSVTYIYLTPAQNKHQTHTHTHTHTHFPTDCNLSPYLCSSSPRSISHPLAHPSAPSDPRPQLVASHDTQWQGRISALLSLRPTILSSSSTHTNTRARTHTHTHDALEVALKISILYNYDKL